MEKENLEAQQEEYIRTLEISVRLLQREVENLREKSNSVTLKPGMEETGSLGKPSMEFYKAYRESEILEILFQKLKNDFLLLECNLFFYGQENRLIGIESAPTDINLSSLVKNLEEEGITDWASELGRPVKIPLLDKDSGGNHALISPLNLRGKMIGLFIAISSSSEMPKGEQADFLVAITEYAAIATDNIRSSREISSMNDRLADMNRRMLHSSQLASLGELASSVARELEHPVKIIEGNVKMIENGIGDIQRRYSIIYQQISLIREFTSKLDKLSSGEENTAQGEIDMRSLLDEVLLISNWQLTRDGIKVEKEYENAPCRVVGNKIQLEQVFLSLLLNARDAMPDGGRINLGVYSSDRNKIMVSVADTGVGIDEHEIKKLFDPESQPAAEGKPGLGLFMTGKIIEKHRGKILVSSDIGKGTTVKVLLPALK